MPFFAILIAATAILPLVMLFTNVRAEWIVGFGVLVILTFFMHRIGFVVLANVAGWLLTLLSLVPGLAPARWMRKPRLKTQGR